MHCLEAHASAHSDPAHPRHAGSENGSGVSTPVTVAAVRSKQYGRDGAELGDASYLLNKDYRLTKVVRDGDVKQDPSPKAETKP